MAKKPVQPPKGKATSNKPQTTKAPTLEELDKTWQESRKKKPMSFDGPPDIPDGDYVVQLTNAKTGAYKSGNKKGTNYFKISYAIVAGDHRGTTVQSSDDISNREVGNQGRTAMDMLSARLQQIGVDISDTPLRELPSLAKALSDPKSEIGRPYLSVKVANNIVDRDDGTKARFQNVYINEPLTDAQVKEAKKALGGD
jgi:hypothetical protein